MPLIHLSTSISHVPNSKKLLKNLSKKISALTKKPEQYVMAILNPDIAMSFAGSDEPCCYVEVKSIGSLLPKEMTPVLCDLIESEIGVSTERIYINYVDIEGQNWGFNRSTFG